MTLESTRYFRRSDGDQSNRSAGSNRATRRQTVAQPSRTVRAEEGTGSTDKVAEKGPRVAGVSRERPRLVFFQGYPRNASVGQQRDRAGTAKSSSRPGSRAQRVR